MQNVLTVGYVYDDVFSDFRGFFRPEIYKSHLLFEIAKLLRPRLIKGPTHTDIAGFVQDRSVIAKEGDEV